MTWAQSAITEPVPSIYGSALHADAPSMVLHTAVSNASDLKSYWESGAAGPGVGSHFYVNKQGVIYEYVPLETQTGHAFAANSFAWGLESWDGGLTIPWNDAQIAAIVELCQELGVPARPLAEDGKGGGVGFHREYASWNLNSHTCPGDLRVAQVPGIITALGGNMAGEADAYFAALSNPGDATAQDFRGNMNYLNGFRYGRRGATPSATQLANPDFKQGNDDGKAWVPAGGGAALKVTLAGTATP